MENEKKHKEEACDIGNSENDILRKQDAQSENTPEDKPRTEGDSDEAIIGKELDEIRTKLADKAKQCDEYYGMLQRIAAEFDNYKKRTAKEKEGLYAEAVSDVISAFLPVVDNLERAAQASCGEGGSHSLKEGVDLVCRQLQDVLKNLGIEAIQSVEKNFDPRLHNAVMHMEDDAYGDNTVVEEFQKGYIYKDKVIRHSLVKVAN